jgi:hypothetical protein
MRGVDNQLERAAVAEANGREVTHVARGDTTEVEILGERHDRSIHEAKTEIRVALVDLHGARELLEGRWRIRECAASKIPHECLHPAPLVSKEVIELCDY